SEKTDLRRRDAVGNESRDPLEHTQRGIFRRARDLLDHELPRRRIEQHEIGVGAAHIHAEPVTRAAHAGLPITVCAGGVPPKAGSQETRTRQRIAALTKLAELWRFLNRRPFAHGGGGTTSSPPSRPRGFGGGAPAAPPSPSGGPWGGRCP